MDQPTLGELAEQLKREKPELFEGRSKPRIDRTHLAIVALTAAYAAFGFLGHRAIEAGEDPNREAWIEWFDENVELSSTMKVANRGMNYVLGGMDQVAQAMGDYEGFQPPPVPVDRTEPDPGPGAEWEAMGR